MSASPYRRPLRGVPRLPRRRSPWRRLALATVVLAMLPFVWSEDTSCDGKPKPFVTGFEILFGKHLEDPAPGGIFLGLLALAIGCGFLAMRTPRPWRRLAGELVAGLASLGSSLLCLVMMTHGRTDQPLVHPAAWIGTLASLALAFEAWWGTGVAFGRGLEHRRRRKAMVAARIAGEDPAPLRIAEVRDDDHDDPHLHEEDEPDGVEDAAPVKRKRALS